MKKTTKADFALFKKTFRKCVKNWGLTDWKIYFRCESIKGFGDITVDHNGHVVTVRMDSEMPEEHYYDFDPAAVAKHEAIHLLVSPLEWLAECRYVQLEEIDQQAERIARQLERIIT